MLVCCGLLLFRFQAGGWIASGCCCFASRVRTAENWFGRCDGVLAVKNLIGAKTRQFRCFLGVAQCVRCASRRLGAWSGMLQRVSCVSGKSSASTRCLVGAVSLRYRAVCGTAAAENYGAVLRADERKRTEASRCQYLEHCAHLLIRR